VSPQRRIRKQARKTARKGELIELSPHKYEFVPDWARKERAK
jgi:hypothetical protein